jgi:serine O-acetyltransferase
MIENKLDFKFYTEADRIISGRKNYFCRFLLVPITLDPIGKFMYLLRLVEYYENCKFYFGEIFKAYYKYRFRRISYKLGFSIPTNVFGPGLYIPHYGTIVINSNCVVGSNCVLHTSVCIAGSERKIIGDNVYISTGVILAGQIDLADNITISANSFVNKNFIQANILIGGSPAKKLKERQAWYNLDGEIYKNRIAKIESLKMRLYEKKYLFFLI